MSKKMLKRSLALGALMAFVITGSAMAGEVVTVIPEMPHNGQPYWSTSEVIKVLGDNGLQSDAKLSRDYALEEDTKDAAANAAKGYSYNPSSSYPDTYLFDLNGNTLTVPGGIAVDGKDSFKVIGTDGSALYLNGGLSIRGTVDIDTLDINNGNLYVYGSQMTVTTKSVSIKNTSSGINVQGDNDSKGGNITVTTDSLTVKSGARALRAAYEGTLNVTAGNVEITSTKSSGASYGAALNLTATNKGSIESDFFAGEIEKSIQKGTVNLTFGKDIVWTGKVTTEDTGTGENSSASTVNLSGTWNLKDVSTDLTGKSNSLTNATFKNGSTFVIEGEKYVYDSKEGAVNTYALNGVGDKATLTVENGAKLNVTGIKETTYNIATGFSEIKGGNYWTVGNIADLNNNLMEGKWLQDEDKNLQLQIAAKETDTLVEELGVSETTGEFLNTLVKDAGEVEDSVTAGSAEAKLVGLAKAAAASDNPVVVAKAAEAIQKMAEAGGNSATAANVVTNVTNVTGQRLSFSGGNAGGNKGGHGVGLLEEGSGAAIWAQYVHGKDSVEDMPSEAGASSYEGQYNGIVMGVDFKKVGKFQSGIAFNYGEGDTNSVNTTSPTRSEYDFWGVGYYGNIRNADSNVIFDIGYAKTDSDVTSNVNVGTLKQTYEASPETTTWTAGVKVEKLYQNNNVQIVPYTGLRYMSIDPDDYSTKCGALSYNLERQNIWMLPVGVSIKQEIVNPNGWVVTPKVDLSYIWAFGDTDSSMETNTVFGSDNRPIGYDVMDDGSWMGLVGVEAAMDDWTFGVSYSYQKGDHSESKKWYVDAKYSF